MRKAIPAVDKGAGSTGGARVSWGERWGRAPLEGWRQDALVLDSHDLDRLDGRGQDASRNDAKILDDRIDRLDRFGWHLVRGLFDIGFGGIVGGIVGLGRVRVDVGDGVIGKRRGVEEAAAAAAGLDRPLDLAGIVSRLEEPGCNSTMSSGLLGFVRQMLGLGASISSGTEKAARCRVLGAIAIAIGRDGDGYGLAAELQNARVEGSKSVAQNKILNAT